MCHRMSPLTFGELQQALDELRRSGHARVPRRDGATVVPDAYPGRDVPLFVPDGDGGLVPAELTWGFPNPSTQDSQPVFNTRIETALSQAQSGRGLWAGPVQQGRCLVPVRAFYERWTQPDPASPEAPRGRRQVRFRLAGRQVFLLAAVQDGRHFSVVTVPPNGDVSPIHSRMPLVLGPGESGVWLGPDFATLADRSGVRLDAQVEEPAAQTA